MIIDCHGHYTTAPEALQVFRDAQIAGLHDPSQVPAKGTVRISSSSSSVSGAAT
jgi:4-oxalmesaconate hydratase